MIKNNKDIKGFSMNKQKLTILISTLIIFLSSFIVFFELKSYTPINKDETEIINNYDKITREMNELIEERKEEESIKKQIEYAKETNAKTEEYIKKYGIKKILIPDDYKHYEKERKILCETEYHSCKPECGYDEAGSPAMRFDFNDDGIDEIIGLLNYGCGPMGCGLFIVKKHNEKYKKIFNSSKGAIFPTTVINHKTDGYYDLSVTISGGRWVGWVNRIIKYDIKENKYDFVD